ncbi:Protein kinase domain-containing protein [Pleurotus pulmonarius]
MSLNGRESLQKQIGTVQESIIQDDRILAHPFMEDTARKGLALLKALQAVDFLDSEADPAAAQELLNISAIFVETLVALWSALKRHEVEGDGSDGPKYSEICKILLEDFAIVVGEASHHSGSQKQDSAWLAVHQQFSTLHERMCGYKKRAEVLFEHNLPAREMRVRGRRTDRLREHGPSRAPSPAMPLPQIPNQILIGSHLYPVACGGFADIWAGEWSGPLGQSKVAIKVPRFHTQSVSTRSKQQKRLRRELSIWQKLRHRHVLELLGTTTDIGPPSSVGMVCLWAEKGNLNNYMTSHKDTMKLSERYRILDEVASGLSYLHSSSVIHGDLTGSNVLLDESAKSCICDFGLSTLIAEVQDTSSNSCVTGAVRWTAPELYKVDQDQDGTAAPRPTVYSDIFSYGRVVLQTLSGEIPYHYLRTDGQVFFELYRNSSPRRPFQPWVTDAHWDLMKECWASIPEERPTLVRIQDFVRTYYELLISVPSINDITDGQ